MNNNVDFGIANIAIKQGHVVYRDNWETGTYLFLKEENQVSLSIVPTMKSLPLAVKGLLIQKLKDDSTYDVINFNAQYAILRPDNSIYSWTPRNEDILAEDWKVLG